MNKNKEEIEKILKGCGEEFLLKTTDNDVSCICGNYYMSSIKLCPTCERAKQERIKTSILWCEDEIEFLNRKKGKWVLDYDESNRIKQLQTHLKWLKEQENLK